MNNIINIVKKVTLVIGIVITIALIGGCQMPDNSKDEGKPFGGEMSSARKYMLKLLEEKYDEDFKVIGKENLTDSPSYGVIYSCYVAPKSDLDKVFSALVDQSKPNEVIDNFAMYFFKEEAEAVVTTLCEDKDYVTAYRIDFVMPSTGKKWSSEDGLQAFLSENSATVEVYVCLVDNKTDKEYAEMIADFTKGIYASGVNTTLKFANSERYIFFRDFLIAGEVQTPYLTNGQILAEMDSAKKIVLKKQGGLVVK